MEKQVIEAIENLVHKTDVVNKRLTITVIGSLCGNCHNDTGGRGADGFGQGNAAQCGITVGASIAEFHEWYKKWHKTGNHTSIVAMQSETLPDSALGTFKHCNR